MGFRTTKIGDTCRIKDTDTTSKVEDIQGGKYKLSGESRLFWAHEIITIPKPPEPKVKTIPVRHNHNIQHKGLQRTPIPRSANKPNQVSKKQEKLNNVYSVIAPKYKIQNPECKAQLPGCTKNTEEIHHMYKRTGIWLLMSEYFLPTCRCCHDKITEGSAMAIEAGLSISRMVDLPEVFTEYEREMMECLLK